MSETLSRIAVAEKGGNDYDVIARPVSKRQRKNRTLIIVGIVVLLCLIGAGVGLGMYLWKKSDEDSPNKVPNQNSGTTATSARTLALIHVIGQLRAPLSGSVDFDTASEHAAFTSQLWEFEKKILDVAQNLAQKVFHMDIPLVHAQFEQHSREISEVEGEVKLSLDVFERDKLKSGRFFGFLESREDVSSIEEPKTHEADDQNTASATLSDHVLHQLNLYRSKVEQLMSIYDDESLQRLLSVTMGSAVSLMNEEMLELVENHARIVIERSSLTSALRAIQGVATAGIEIQEPVAKAIATLAEAIPGVDRSMASLYLDRVGSLMALRDAKSLFLVHDTIFFLKPQKKRRISFFFATCLFFFVVCAIFFSLCL